MREHAARPGWVRVAGSTAALLAMLGTLSGCLRAQRSASPLAPDAASDSRVDLLQRDLGDLPWVDPQPDGGDLGPPSPPIADLVDDFDGATLSDLWFVPKGGCEIVQQAGELVFNLPDDQQPHYCLVNSKQTYDLRGGRLTVMVAKVCSGPVGLQTVIYLRAGSGPDYIVLKEGAGFQTFLSQASGNVPFTKVDASPYQADRDRVWSLREAEGVLYFETAPDTNGPFSLRAKIATTVPVDHIRVTLGSGRHKGTDICETRFDCVNVPCP